MGRQLKQSVRRKVFAAPQRKRPIELTREQVICRSKQWFPDRGNAIKGAKWALNNGRCSVLWVYKCDVCAGWHMTSREGDPRNQVTPPAAARTLTSSGC